MRRPLKLGQHLFGPLDRTGHELREEADECGKPQEIPLPRHLSQVKVDGVAHRLEREKRNPHRQHIFPPVRHQRRGIGKSDRRMHGGEEMVEVLLDKSRVFEKEQQRRLLMMLIRATPCGWRARPPIAISETRTVNAISVGRSVGGPTIANAINANAIKAAAGKCNLQNAIDRPTLQMLKQFAAALARRAMVHQRDQQIVQRRRIDHQQQVIRIPPGVKEVRRRQQPWNPKPRAANPIKHRQHNQHEDQKWPGVKKHAITLQMLFTLSRYSGRGRMRARSGSLHQAVPTASATVLNPSRRRSSSKPRLISRGSVIPL